MWKKLPQKQELMDVQRVRKARRAARGIAAAKQAIKMMMMHLAGTWVEGRGTPRVTLLGLAYRQDPTSSP